MLYAYLRFEQGKGETEKDAIDLDKLTITPF